MNWMKLTFFCKPGAPSIGGPFAAEGFQPDEAEFILPLMVPVALQLNNPTREGEILWLEIRLHGDSNYSVLLETPSLGVVHAGLQAEPTSNTFSLRYRIERPQLLFLWKGKRGFLEDSVLFAIYPKGDVLKPNDDPMTIGPQLPSFTPNVFSQRPAWSWAPLQDIHSIKVQEQDAGVGFIGMYIYYNNGAQRFIGDYARFILGADMTDYVTLAPITHMYVEKWVPPVLPFWRNWPSRFLKMRVDFSVPGIRRSMHTQFDECKLEGELHFWFGPAMEPEFRVLPSGSWED
ncbi:hypothetical protein FCIRC_10080 [Fusarium circinatum]|uniref:Uncharacterized protein n=1 Tax=Fusarium circinatum TaxID=48490 RepID=A0A8H5WQ01_FUSCI|nr:hypothetical protein FCIRC_10080 [Fusarium circinatum]